MDTSTRATELTDLADLGSFLVEGFHAPVDSTFARVETLRWKYFDPRGGSGTELEQRSEPRSWLRLISGRIAAHVGICPTEFQVVGGRADRLRVPTLHMIDWLADPAHPSSGARLMLQAERGVPTQYGLGGSEAGRRVIAGHGYELFGGVPLFSLVTRPSSWFRRQDVRISGRFARAGRDALRLGRAGLLRTASRARWRPVSAFHETDEDVPTPSRFLERFPNPILTTRRDAAILNHLLRCPDSTAKIEGGYLDFQGEARGFALLSTLRRGPLRIGKIVECWLDTTDVVMLAESLRLLCGELRERGVDLVEAYGGQPWRDDSLGRAGFRLVDRLDLRLRDRERRLPRDLPIHVSPVEADYAST